MIGAKNVLSAAEFDEWFDYNFVTGSLYWRKRPSIPVSAGSLAGRINNEGYRAIKFKNKNYMAHILIYSRFVGEIPSDLLVDHKDLNKDHNVLGNFRLVSPQQNSFNRLANGCYYYAAIKRWRAEIKVNGKKKYLGNFRTEAEAQEAYQEASIKYRGEYSPYAQSQDHS